MKLFVYCPERYYNKKDTVEWQQAIKLSNHAKLPIVSHINGFSDLTVPQIISMPEKRIYDVDKVVKSGFIHRVDLTDEFNEMGVSISAYITNELGHEYTNPPTIRELHKVKFRMRHYSVGKHTVVVKDDNRIYLEETFNVV